MSRLPYSANRVKGTVDFMLILVYVRYLMGYTDTVNYIHDFNVI